MHHRFTEPASIVELQHVVPAVFNTQPHPNLFDRYKLVPTVLLIEIMDELGWGVSYAAQMEPKDKHYANTAKHLLRFRQKNQFMNQGFEWFHELAFLGSHDGSTASWLYQGIFRLVCLNGMVTGSSHASLRVTHRDGSLETLLEGLKAMATYNLNDVIQAMKLRETTQEERHYLAKEAFGLRWSPDPLLFTTLLHTRREEDAYNNLWSVLNRIQENMMLGGFETTGPSGRRGRAMPLRDVGATIKHNRALWTAAEALI